MFKKDIQNISENAKEIKDEIKEDVIEIKDDIKKDITKLCNTSIIGFSLGIGFLAGAISTALVYLITKK